MIFVSFCHRQLEVAELESTWLYFLCININVTEAFKFFFQLCHVSGVCDAKERRTCTTHKSSPGWWWWWCRWSGSTLFTLLVSFMSRFGKFNLPQKWKISRVFQLKKNTKWASTQNGVVFIRHFRLIHISSLSSSSWEHAHVPFIHIPSWCARRINELFSFRLHIYLKACTRMRFVKSWSSTKAFRTCSLNGFFSPRYSPIETRDKEKFITVKHDESHGCC